MEFLGEISKLCIEQKIEFLDPKSFCYIQNNRSSNKDKSRSEEDKKIKEGIDLVMKRELEGIKICVCWICKEFGHFSFRCSTRVRKIRKSSLSDDDEEFKASMERLLNDSNYDEHVEKE